MHIASYRLKVFLSIEGFLFADMKDFYQRLKDCVPRLESLLNADTEELDAVSSSSRKRKVKRRKKKDHWDWTLDLVTQDKSAIIKKMLIMNCMFFCVFLGSFY